MIVKIIITIIIITIIIIIIIIIVIIRRRTFSLNPKKLDVLILKKGVEHCRFFFFKKVIQ